MKRIIKFFTVILTLAGFLVIFSCQQPVKEKNTNTDTTPAYSPEITGTWIQNVSGGTQSYKMDGSSITFTSTQPITAGFYTMSIVGYDES